MKVLFNKSINQHVEELNKMNLFPIPDKDTGTNLKATLECIENIEFNNLRDYLKNISDKLILNARGSSGNILALFTIGLSKNYSENLSEMCKKAAEFTWATMYDPKEGTILTAMKSVPEEYKDYRDFINQYYENVKRVYDEDYKKIEILNKNNQKDSGTLGFLYILEDLRELI